MNQNPQNQMLIDGAYKVLTAALAGNPVSATVYNDWAANNGMPPCDDLCYQGVKTYSDFYALAYYFIFGN